MRHIFLFGPCRNQEDVQLPAGAAADDSNHYYAVVHLHRPLRETDDEEQDPHLQACPVRPLDPPQKLCLPPRLTRQLIHIIVRHDAAEDSI